MYEKRETLGRLFYESVGIVRDNISLHLAQEEVLSMQQALGQMGLMDKSRQNNTNLIDLLEFSNALLLAPSIISTAITRDESRGAHYKVGFKAQDDENFSKHLTLQRKKA